MKLHKQPRISDGKICKIYVESDTRGANFVMPEPHCHPYCELYYIHRGACRFFIEDGIIDLREGDFFVHSRAGISLHPLCLRHMQKDVRFFLGVTSLKTGRWTFCREAITFLPRRTFLRWANCTAGISIHL